MSWEGMGTSRIGRGGNCTDILSLFPTLIYLCGFTWTCTSKMVSTDLRRLVLVEAYPQAREKYLLTWRRLRELHTCRMQLTLQRDSYIDVEWNAFR